MGLRERLDRPDVDLAALRHEADHRSNELIVDALTRRHPDDAILSEEAADDAARLHCRRVWLVDPLDGTREFSEAGRVDWAVHVALVIDGSPAAGAVALPAQGVTLSTDAPPVIHPRTAGAPRLVVSRTRPPDLVAPLAERMGASVVGMGSAGAKAMAVVRGDADVYVHAGGQYEWDSAAPVAVAAVAGLHASRIDGSPLRYNNADPWLPDLVICSTGLAALVLDALAALIFSSPGAPVDREPPTAG